jgi:hypothetical protein
MMKKLSMTPEIEIFEDERGAVRLVRSLCYYFVEEIPKKEIRDNCIKNNIRFPETKNILEKDMRFNNYDEAIAFIDKL